MPLLMNVLNILLWPGDRFCAQIGTSAQDDSGMLRGFINSVVWGLVTVIVLWITL